MAILGFDIGGTKSAVILGERDGSVLERRVMPSPLQLPPAEMLATLAGVAEQLVREAGGAQPEAAGVSIGGPLDSEAGVVLGPPHLPGWDEVPVRELLEQRLQLPVYVEHDARSGALAEWHFGAGRRTDGSTVDDLVFLTLGTGLGAGIISGRRLLHGRTGLTAEVGHWRVAGDGPEVFGKRGSWESYCGGAGIVALAGWRYPRLFAQITLPELAALARDGSPQARAVFEESAAMLGHGIALLGDLFAPEVVALGALALRIGDLLLPIARAVFEREVLPSVAQRCRIVPAGLGERIGDVAAICAALYRLERW